MLPSAPKNRKTGPNSPPYSKYPPDTRVVATGYEGGFNDITIHIELDANKEWWNGQHEEVQSSGEETLLPTWENRISERYLEKKGEEID